MTSVLALYSTQINSLNTVFSSYAEQANSVTISIKTSQDFHLAEEYINKQVSSSKKGKI